MNPYSLALILIRFLGLYSILDSASYMLPQLVVALTSGHAAQLGGAQFAVLSVCLPQFVVGAILLIYSTRLALMMADGAEQSKTDGENSYPSVARLAFALLGCFVLSRAIPGLLSSIYRSSFHEFSTTESGRAALLQETLRAIFGVALIWGRDRISNAIAVKKSQ